MRLGRRVLPARAAAIIAAAICTVALLPGTAQAAPADRWTSESGGGGNSYHNPGETVLTPANGGRLALAWQDDDWRGPITAPTVVDGLLYRIVDNGSASQPTTLEVRSVRTGALQWTLALPGQASYDRGVTVLPSRQRLVVSYTGDRKPGGVLAVDLTRRAVAWIRELPAALDSWASNHIAGPVVADVERVYTSGAGRAVLAYRLTDGAPLWSLRHPTNINGTPRKLYGMAVANGVLYRGDDGGLTAHAALGGRKLWTARGHGMPVVAGGRVFMGSSGGVSAFAAGGCNSSTCAPLWSRPLASLAIPALVGGATGTELFVTYRLNESPEGRISRLSASDGSVTWTARAGRGFGQPVRGGGTVWAFMTFVDDGGTVDMGLVGYSATARGTTPLRFLDMPGGAAAQGGIAVAGGSVLVQRWAGPLLGYRVPGT